METTKKKQGKIFANKELQKEIIQENKRGKQFKTRNTPPPIPTRKKKGQGRNSQGPVDSIGISNSFSFLRPQIYHLDTIIGNEKSARGFAD